MKSSRPKRRSGIRTSSVTSVRNKMMSDKPVLRAREDNEDNELERNPPPEHDTAEWLDDIGPDDMARAAVMAELEASGFDLLTEDDFVSNPSFPSDQPDWSED